MRIRKMCVRESTVRDTVGGADAGGGGHGHVVGDVDGHGGDHVHNACGFVEFWC